MHALHDYISTQLRDKLKSRRVVVWYDQYQEFTPYFEELGSGETPLAKVAIDSISAHIARYSGSFYALRLAVEPLVAIDKPAPLVIYLPGIKHDAKNSPLMELEKAADKVWEPGLKGLARHVLRKQYTDGVIDEMLAPDRITYGDIVQYLAQGTGGEQPSMLKAIFTESDSQSLLACWLVNSEHDESILVKEATDELYKLIDARLGLALSPTTSLDDARAKTRRYVLVNEFRTDLQCDPPSSVGMVPAPATQELLQRVRALAERLRKTYPVEYTDIADTTAADLGLHVAEIKACYMGSVDTFRFEERTLLRYCGELIVEGKYSEALHLIDERGHSFWVDRDVTRQAQWEVCRPLAELGLAMRDIHLPSNGSKGDPQQWVDGYARRDNGWYRLDQIQRKLEAWVAQMDDEPEVEQALWVIRRQYEETLRKMAEGFTEVFKQAGWSISGILPQTRIYPEVVEPGAGSVAYFLVDAMRYEMGVELAGQLTEADELTLRPAAAALPTITQIGMAALLPGTSAGFSVIEHNQRLAARVDGMNLANVADRMKYLQGKVPGAIELTLGKVLQSSTKKLEKELATAPLVVVRSQEIDALGESGDDLTARQFMDTVIGNITRAVKKLAGLGIERFVISADHGYQFTMRKEEDMRTDAPGGNTVELHRRCWAGHGGATPPGAVRVSGAELGYATDLDFIFPVGLGIFKAPGGLSYHHGGISLQELLVPVIAFRLAARHDDDTPKLNMQLTFTPEAITNRTFGFRLRVEKTLFAGDAVPVRTILLWKEEQVGQVGMAIDAVHDRTTGLVTLTPGHEASIGMMLQRDDCEWVRILVLDPTTDAVLLQSDEIPVKLVI